VENTTRHRLINFGRRWCNQCQCGKSGKGGKGGKLKKGEGFVSAGASWANCGSYGRLCDTADNLEKTWWITTRLDDTSYVRGIR
jgi:hypothetical protein